MKQRQPKNLFSRFFTSRLFFMVVGGLVLLFALGFARAYYQAYKIQQQIDALHDEASALKQKRLESLDILSYVLSQNFVEEKAREELNLKKDGEHVIVVPTADEPSAATQSRNVAATGQPFANPLKWWYYFAYHSLQ